MKKKNYALLDWDNTLREGFLLFSWIEYLVERSIVSAALLDDIEECKRKYQYNTISYRELSIRTVKCYSYNLLGLSQNEIEVYISNYLKIDEHSFYPFVPMLFDLLDEFHIDPIIISGSPKMIIGNYANQFGFSSIYAVEVGVRNGVYTGKVKSNYGYDKERIVDHLLRSYQCAPLLAFGDALADLPMLQAAKTGFWVGNGHGEIDKEKHISFSPFDSPERIIELIREIIVDNL